MFKGSTRKDLQFPQVEQSGHVSFSLFPLIDSLFTLCLLFVLEDIRHSLPTFQLFPSNILSVVERGPMVSSLVLTQFLPFVSFSVIYSTPFFLNVPLWTVLCVLYDSHISSTISSFPSSIYVSLVRGYSSHESSVSSQLNSRRRSRWLRLLIPTSNLSDSILVTDFERFVLTFLLYSWHRFQLKSDPFHLSLGLSCLVSGQGVFPL